MAAPVNPCEDGCAVCKGLVEAEDVVDEGGAVVEHGEGEGIVADIVVADLTPSEAELEVGEVGEVLHEVLLVDAPGEGE